MRVVFHIGVHKTGSTLFQQNILQNADALLGQGVYTANAHAPDYMIALRDKLRSLQNNRRKPPPPAKLDQISAKVRTAASEAGAHTILISDENICGRPLHKQLLFAEAGDQLTLYPDATNCLRMATWGFRDLETDLIMYTRAQHSFIPSLYSEGLKALRLTKTLPEFVDCVDLQNIRFSDLADRVRAGAPHARLTIRQFEAVKNGPAAYVSSFFDAARITPMDVTLHSEKVRPRLSLEQGNQLRALAEKLPTTTRRQALKRRAARVMRTTPPNPTQLALPDEMVSFLRARYANDISYAPSLDG